MLSKIPRLIVLNESEPKFIDSMRILVNQSIPFAGVMHLVQTKTMGMGALVRNLHSTLIPNVISDLKVEKGNILPRDVLFCDGYGEVLERLPRRAWGS